MRAILLSLVLAVVFLMQTPRVEASCLIEYKIWGLVYDGFDKWNMSGTATDCDEEPIRALPYHPDPAHRWRKIGPNKMAVGPALLPLIYIPPEEAGILNITLDTAAYTSVNWTLHPFRLSNWHCCTNGYGVCGYTCQYNYFCSWDISAGDNPIETPTEPGKDFIEAPFDNIDPYDDDDNNWMPVMMCYMDDNHLLNTGYSTTGYMPGPTQTPQVPTQDDKITTIDEEELMAIEKAVDMARAKREQLKAKKAEKN